jgi:O-antigen/teichoic acid export membrane protein
VVLNTLGAEDYGIYNVVAGTVTMFGFLSSSMATASQRYFSFEIGRGDYEQLRRVFSLSLTIYVMIAVLVLILAETVGLWFVANKLVIPLERKNAAIWVYHLSIVSFSCTILNTPYIAMIVAHEDMNIYAYVAIIEAVLRLSVVFVLPFLLLDKLQMYGILVCAITIINSLSYKIICKIKYYECRIKFYWDTILFKEIISYTGWSLFGAIGNIAKKQLIDILVNQFFSPIIVSSRSIAFSVNAAVSSFANNFSMAMRPHIVKSYASCRKDTLSFVFLGIKCIFFLLYIFTLPLALEISFVLSVWLGSIPDYTILFIRLTLIDILVDCIGYPITTFIQATGKIKLYIFIVTCIQLLNFPFAWLIFAFGGNPTFVMVSSIFITFIMLIMRIILLKNVVDYSISNFIKAVLLPIFFVMIISSILPVIIHINLESDFIRLLIVTCVSFIMISICMFFIGLSKKEKKLVNIFVKTS